MKPTPNTPAAIVTTLSLCAGLSLIPAAAQALDWDALWRNADQRGAQEMERQDYAAAARTFEDERWRAAALYRAGEYERSADAWAKMDDVDAHYNRGNALARTGDLQGAMEEYETVLKRDPGNVDARHNLEAIKKLMRKSRKSGSSDDRNRQQSEKDKDGRGGDGSRQEQQQQQQSASRGDKDRDEKSSGDREQDQSRGGRQSREDKGDNADNPEQQQAEASQAEPAREDGGNERAAASDTVAKAQTPEQQAAMEQWLRRIPDDPGGLLRRKFRYQYSQRDYGDEPTDEPW